MQDSIEQQELGVSDDERAKRLAVMDKTTGKDIKRKWEQGDRQALESAERKIAPPVIIEPRCRVCNSEYRAFIEQMVVKGHSYQSIAERVPVGENDKPIERRSIANHFEKHMELERKRIRQELDDEADMLGRNVAQGVNDAITDRGMLKVLARKAFDDAMKGITTVEPKDLIQMLKLLNDLDVTASSTKAEEMEVSLRIFTRALQNVLDQDTIGVVITEVKRLRGLDDVEFNVEGALDRPQLEEGDDDAALSTPDSATA